MFYREREINRFTEKQMAELRAGAFGFVFQQTHLVSSLTLFENVAVAGYLNRKQSEQAVRDRAAQLLSRMRVEKAASRYPA